MKYDDETPAEARIMQYRLHETKISETFNLTSQSIWQEDPSQRGSPEHRKVLLVVL